MQEEFVESIQVDASRILAYVYGVQNKLNVVRVTGDKLAMADAGMAAELVATQIRGSLERHK